MTCAFCHQSSDSGTYNRMAGLDVCDRCRMQGVIEHLHAHGHGAERRLQFTGGQRSKGGQQTVLELDITLPVDPGLQLQCIKEQGYPLRKLFRKELQVGDPIFDDHVYIYEGDSEAVADLLSHEGIQSAILLVSIHGSFVLDGPRLSTRCIFRLRPTDEDLRAVELEVAAAALHIVDWVIARRG